MLLAQAHAMRNRYAEAEAVLAAAEPLARGQAGDSEYVKQRLSLSLEPAARRRGRPRCSNASTGWADSERWRGFIERMRSTYVALADGFGPPELSAAIAANETLPDESRRLAAPPCTASRSSSRTGRPRCRGSVRRAAGVPLRDPVTRRRCASLIAIVDTGNR